MPPKYKGIIIPVTKYNATLSKESTNGRYSPYFYYHFPEDDFQFVVTTGTGVRGFETRTEAEKYVISIQ